MGKKEIDDFLNLNEKEFKTNKYGSGKLLPFFEDIKYMKDKKIPNKIIIKYLKDKKSITVSETNFSLFLLRNGLRKMKNEKNEKEKITKIKKADDCKTVALKVESAKTAAANFINNDWRLKDGK